MRRLIALTALIFILGGTSSALASPRSLAWAVSQKVFGSHAAVAFCIAGWETGHTYNASAVSPTNDHGEWQIHGGLQTYGRQIYNIWFNARIAYRMSHGGTNWLPWTTHRYCGV